MGRTTPSISIAFWQEQAAFSKFRRALRRSDQWVLDELFAFARRTMAPQAPGSRRLRRPPSAV
jgi:hypothetical protein